MDLKHWLKISYKPFWAYRSRLIGTKNVRFHSTNSYKEISSNCYNDFKSFDEPLKEHLSSLEKVFLPSKANSLGYYINHSKSLQALISFQVEIHKIQKKFPHLLDVLTKLNIKNELRPKLIFLRDLGFIPDEFGVILTNNPFILDPDKTVDDMKEVIEYFKSKNFSDEQLASIIKRAPTLLNLNPIDIDKILGFIQKFQLSCRPLMLTSDEVRTIVIKHPNIIKYNPESLFLNGQLFERTFGFQPKEIRQLIVKMPKILTMETKNLQMIYLFLNRELNISNEEVLDNYQLFDVRLRIAEFRHKYLIELGKAQYNTYEVGYLSPISVFCCSDEEFCKNCGIQNVNEFYKFIKTV